jgi:uncharacterized protein
MKKTIIIDTNALLAISEFKLDLFEELKESLDFNFTLNIISPTLDELEKIKLEQRGKYKLAASIALQLINTKNINIIKKEGYVDDLLVELSKENNLILTQDIALKKRLQKPYLTIRQKKKIILVK